MLQLIGGAKPVGTTMRDLLQDDRAKDLPALLVASSTPAIISGEAAEAAAPPSLTHAELREFVTSDPSIAAAFARSDVGVGDRVALVLPSGPTAAVATVALLARCACAPINDRATKDEIAAELVDTRAKLVLALGGGAHTQVKAAAEIAGVPMLVVTPRAAGLFAIEAPLTASAEPRFSRGSDVALVLHTSGTTGIKKVVPHTLEGLTVGAACVIASWQLGPSDVALSMMPLYHVGGVVRNLIAPLLAGGALVACPLFDPHKFWALAASTITWYYASPTMHQLILRAAAEHTAAGAPRVRLVANAAGALLPSLAVQLKETFSNASVLPSYGMTECMPISSPPFEYRLDRPGTSGVAVGPELAVFPLAEADREHGGADEAKGGEDVDSSAPCFVLAADGSEESKHGRTGRICVRGPPVMSGYENNVEANAASFDSAGWFDTGDLGHLDADGFVFLTGRKKEVINRGGEIISPFEVEEALGAHPQVREVMAFAAPHEVLQECVGVALVLEPGADPHDCSVRALQRFAAVALHPSKWPQVVVLMDGLPKSSTGGKLLRVRFAQRCGMADISDAVAPEARLFSASAPPIGVPLSTQIALRAVKLAVHGTTDAVVIDVEQAGVNEAIYKQVSKMISDITGGRAAPHDHLVGLGIDSLNLLELSRKLQHVFDAQGLDLFLVGNPSVTELCAYLEGGGAADAQTMNIPAVFGLRSFLQYW